MKPVFIAVILALAVIVVVLLIAFRRKGTRTMPPQQTGADDIPDWLSPLIAGKPAIPIEPRDRFASPRHNELVEQVAKDLIQDENQRFIWMTFDAYFHQQCLRENKDGWDFDQEAFRQFQQEGYDYWFSYGVSIYNECANRIIEENDQDAAMFAHLAQIYWMIVKVLNPEHAILVEWWQASGKQEAPCEFCQTRVLIGDGGLVWPIGKTDSEKAIHNAVLVCDACYQGVKTGEAHTGN